MPRRTCSRFPRRFRPFLASTFAAVCTVALLWQALQASPATTDSLGGEERYLTLLSTDKPIYRAGDFVYLRGVLLHALTHRPYAASGQVGVQVKGPKGDIVASGAGVVQDGGFGYRWAVPEGLAGGEYTFRVTHPSQGWAPAERKFDVRTYRPPRLKSQIVFLRDGYGPGDTVQASLHTERAEGGIPASAPVTRSAR